MASQRTYPMKHILTLLALSLCPLHSAKQTVRWFTTRTTTVMLIWKIFCPSSLCSATQIQTKTGCTTAKMDASICNRAISSITTLNFAPTPAPMETVLSIVPSTQTAMASAMDQFHEELPRVTLPNRKLVVSAGLRKTYAHKTTPTVMTSCWVIFPGQPNTQDIRIMQC